MTEKKRSSNYVMTIDTWCIYGQREIEVIKEAVKVMNKISSDKKRVVLRGRKPKVKQTRSYDRGGNIVGGLENATEIDVYIYDRRS